MLSLFDGARFVSVLLREAFGGFTTVRSHLVC